MKIPEVSIPNGMPVNLMLDSGAFSAWTHGQEIDVKDYIAYIKEFGWLFDSIVTLDVIPGEFGVRKETKDIERAVHKSYENHQEMKAAGIKSIPVFHQYENFKYLERMLEDGEEYIGISPSGDNISMSSDWFRDVFHIITDDEGYPVVKTHGFGVTSIPIMMRFPWYSMDSVTWVIKSGYGCIFVPPERVDKRGEPDYYNNPTSLWVTGAPRKNVKRLEYEHLSGGLRNDELSITAEYVERFFRDCIGISEGAIRYNAYSRMEAMARYFWEIRKRLVYSPYAESSRSFFNRKSSRERMVWPMKNMIFAVGPLSNTKRSDILNTFKIERRLVSYFDLREVEPEDLLMYRGNGAVKAYKPSQLRIDFTQWDRLIYLNRRRTKLSDRVMQSAEVMHEFLE